MKLLKYEVGGRFDRINYFFESEGFKENLFTLTLIELYFLFKAKYILGYSGKMYPWSMDDI